MKLDVFVVMIPCIIYYLIRSENLHGSEKGSGESIEMKDKKVHIDPNGNPTKGYVLR